MSLIETVADAEAFEPVDPANLAFLTQTTLSVDDTAAIMEVLQRRFPAIVAPKADDICYATSNRQAAVKAIAGAVDLVLVIGAPNSSNSLRLVEVAEREGTSAKLVQRATDLDWSWLAGCGSVGITAGASAPEVLVRELVDLLASRFEVTEREVATTHESLTFKLPRELQAA
jgi:4-hydroxy-3-methylbut-2-enyl diphosphate reductase